jgi:hypothetical protein
MRALSTRYMEVMCNLYSPTKGQAANHCVGVRGTRHDRQHAGDPHERQRSKPMPPKCPPISDVMIFSDDARLAAEVSFIFATRGVYLPVIDGPRVQRPDHEGEVIRRINADARAD